MLKIPNLPQPKQHPDFILMEMLEKRDRLKKRGQELLKQPKL